MYSIIKSRAIGIFKDSIFQHATDKHHSQNCSKWPRYSKVVGTKEDIKHIQKHKEETFPKKKTQFMGELMLKFEVKVERI